MLHSFVLVLFWNSALMANGNLLNIFLKGCLRQKETILRLIESLWLLDLLWKGGDVFLLVNILLF